jgi:hypothetical protein
LVVFALTTFAFLGALTLPFASATFDTAIGALMVIVVPFSVRERGLTCFLIWLIPSTITFACFGVGEKNQDPLQLYLADVMVSPASLAGVPAISVPAGKNSQGLPVGVQIIGARLNEKTVLQVGNLLRNSF